jgi:hypothetical protein
MIDNNIRLHILGFLFGFVYIIDKFIFNKALDHLYKNILLFLNKFHTKKWHYKPSLVLGNVG